MAVSGLPQEKAVDLTHCMCASRHLPTVRFLRLVNLIGVLQQMTCRALTPNEISYSAAISASEKRKQWVAAV